MDFQERLRQIFSDSLNILPAKVVDALHFNSIPEWDSVAHMALVAAIESSFDIMLDTDDVIDMSSFAEATRIVSRHLGEWPNSAANPAIPPKPTSCNSSEQSARDPTGGTWLFSVPAHTVRRLI